MSTQLQAPTQVNLAWDGFKTGGKLGTCGGVVLYAGSIAGGPVSGLFAITCGIIGAGYYWWTYDDTVRKINNKNQESELRNGLDLAQTSRQVDNALELTANARNDFKLAGRDHEYRVLWLTSSSKRFTVKLSELGCNPGLLTASTPCLKEFTESLRDLGFMQRSKIPLAKVSDDAHFQARAETVKKTFTEEDSSTRMCSMLKQLDDFFHLEMNGRKSAAVIDFLFEPLSSAYELTARQLESQPFYPDRLDGPILNEEPV